MGKTHTAKIHREWLERIPGPGEPDPDAPLRFPLPADEDPPFPPPPQRKEDEEGEEGPPVPADGTDGAADGEESAEATDDGTGDSTGDTGDAEQDGDDLSLKIPDEVDERRQEEREKRRRSGRNLGLAHRAFALEGHYLRNLGARFARMVSKVAEDSADMPSQGDEEWDIPELLRRRFTGRMVNQCRMTREKRKVAVVLDTSPSCEHQARLFGSIANIAEELGDCDLYDAPNFAIMARKTGQEWETLPDAEREWAFRGRVVLAFGDFDGLDRICKASAVRGNKIYWFCCEERPQVLEYSRDTFVKKFKGHYLPATTLNQLMTAMRKVR